MMQISSDKIRRAFVSTGTDKVRHGYHNSYVDVFEKIVPNSILEIGIKEGKSLASWKLLFPDAEIIGLDITDKQIDKKFINFANAKIIITDSTKENNITANCKYDIIIDDGSHNYKDIIKTFSMFSENFIHAYVIEDVMYNIDQIISCIQSKGFTNIRIYESQIKDVKVPVWWLLDPNVKSFSSETTLVSLNMLVVYRK